MTIILPDRPLPEGWRWTRLEEVCEIVGGATPQTNISEYWNGDIVWVTPTDLSGLEERYIYSTQRKLSQSGYDSCSAGLVPVGSVVMSTRAPIGYLGIAAVPLCVNQGCKCFIPKETIDSKFLFFSLHKNMNHIEAMGSGTTFPEVSKGALQRFLIPLPPLDEQRRIVARLEERLAAAERARCAAEEILAATVAMPKALLREILPLRQNLPQRWRWVRVGDVCKVFAGGPAPQGQRYFNNDGPFFFRVSDLGFYRRTMNLTTTRDRLSPDALLERHLVLARKGAILFPKSGAAVATNNRAMLAADGYIVSHLMALEAKGNILPEWLYHVMCQIDMMVYADNTGYPSLKKSVVERISIPLPPLDEQRRIVARIEEQLAAVERARREAEAQVQAMAAVSTALLRDAFAAAL